MNNTPSQNQIDRILGQYDLEEGDKNLARECMLELCHVCDTQKQFSRLSDLFANLSDGIIVLDSRLNIIDSNKLGKDFCRQFQVFTYNDQDYLLKDLPVIELILNNENSPQTITVHSFNKQNHKKIFNLTFSPTYSSFSEPVGICVVISDVTEVQKQARQLEDMMASFTHDLKTPLIAAEINISHLLEGQFGDLNSSQAQILKLLLQSNAGALRLIKNLLAVFKYETRSHKLLIKNIKIRSLIHNALSVLEPLLESKNLTINTEFQDSELSIRCDSFEIERVLTNLISNAIKFSNNYGKIIIKVENKMDWAIFSVEDEGCGIASDKIDQLFNRFWQSKVNGNGYHGTGLGLYLSRQIVEAHNGTIWAESKEGHGTKVSFKIPIISKNT